VQGVKGGYTLGKTMDEITVADIAIAIEGKPHLVRCGVTPDSCEIFSSCHHRGYLNNLQYKIQELLTATTLHSLLDEIKP
jgi:Rrf2 family protein